LSGWPFYTGDRSLILELDPYGEIVAVDVEGDVNVIGVQVRTGRIMEPLSCGRFSLVGDTQRC